MYHIQTTAQIYQVAYDTGTTPQINPFFVLDKSGPEIVNGGKIYKAIPIGFDFELDGMTFDSVNVAENGFLRFQTNGVNQKFISAFECDLGDRYSAGSNVSPIIYNTFGTPGSRVMKIRYINAGFDNDAEDNDFIEFEIWLHEECGDFEVRIDYKSIEPQEFDLFYNQNPAPFIGYGSYAPPQSYLIEGGYSLPYFDTDYESLSSVPPEGSIYKFTKCGFTNILENTLDISIYPNPAINSININAEGLEQIDIFNCTGQLIHTIRTTLVNNEIDISELPAGMYFIQINNTTLRKFIKD